MAGIPIPVIFRFCIFLIMSYIMYHTRWGCSTYAVGGNIKAANASGINTRLVTMVAYLLNGALVGIAAVLFMSRVNDGLSAGASGSEMDALTATIVGGTSIAFAVIWDIYSKSRQNYIKGK